MRAGTQTLIQALQAIPWDAEGELDDEMPTNQEIPLDDSDSESNPGMHSVLSVEHSNG